MCISYYINIEISACAARRAELCRLSLALMRRGCNDDSWLTVVDSWLTLQVCLMNNIDLPQAASELVQLAAVRPPTPPSLQL